MKKKKLWLTLCLCLILFVMSCGQNLPESYGIYAYTDKGRIPLNGQKVLFVGNIFQSITGLKGASGPGYNSVKHFIAFEKDINPKSIRLAKLEFRKGGAVSNPFGSTHVTVNLWVAVKSIGMDIAPIEGKKDMYKLTPKENLAQGFYALHFGGLGNVATLEAAFGNIAFDFVVGDSSNYQSYEVLQKRNEEKVRSEAERLLTTMNNYFNSRDYVKMKQIYRPNGKVLSESEWQDFIKGLGTWLDNAGKIVNSRIASSNIADNEGVFQLETTYERKGQQSERLLVRMIDGKYYIISLE